MNKSLSLLALSLIGFSAVTLAKGRFETYDYGKFKLHVYYSNDVMADASYIVEGDKGLVTLEEPLFKENVTEFGKQLESFKKPVVQRIASYHIGGTADNEIVMPKGMPAFSVGPVYGGMMNHFQELFGDAMTDLPTGKRSEVDFGATKKYAGVSFEFLRGASTDFPGASILIGKKIYYTHWTPAKAHVSNLQVSSPAAIDAEIAESEKALASGAELFIGGHGGAAKADAVQFKIEYLKTLKKLLAENNNADSFAEAVKKAYPNLPGENGLADLANTLYKK